MPLTFYIYINYNLSMLHIINKLFKRQIRWEKPIEINYYKLSKILWKQEKRKR